MAGRQGGGGAGSGCVQVTLENLNVINDEQNKPDAGDGEGDGPEERRVYGGYGVPEEQADKGEGKGGKKGFGTGIVGQCLLHLSIGDHCYVGGGPGVGQGCGDEQDVEGHPEAGHVEELDSDELLQAEDEVEGGEHEMGFGGEVDDPKAEEIVVHEGVPEGDAKEQALQTGDEQPDCPRKGKLADGGGQFTA